MGPADETPFYVGYRKEAGEAVRRFVRPLVLGVFAGGLLLAALSSAGHRRLARATFEFGTSRTFQGVVQERPQPMLLVERPGAEEAERWSRYLLVGLGKFGAGPQVAGLDGRRVRLAGTLVYRNGGTMLELADGRPADLGPGPPLPPPVAEGPVTVRGEIVDSKCFLGVMNPGHLKTHRACAARCISGGIPPVLCVRHEDRARYLLLVDEAGGPLGPPLPDLVAEPVEVTGTVWRHGDLRFLHAAPSAFRRTE
jgi:hypothetical protein